MITYQGTEKRYYYNKDKIQPILDKVKGKEFSELSSQEEIADIMSALEGFLDTVDVREEETTFERHETEEEAREYFGPEFIKEWNDLLQELDKQQVTTALHGTLLSNGKSICETGLKYKMSALAGTSVLQSMPCGDENYDYPQFESLLNWGHRRYKCLVIVSIPYECSYKEGIWTVGQSNNSGYDYNYVVDPDFIVGYIDVENKKIVKNPNYSRTHDYTGKEPDQHFFHENKDLDNDKVAEILKKQKEEFSQTEVTPSTIEPTPEPEMEPEDLRYFFDDIIYHFAALQNSDVDYVSEKNKELQIDAIVSYLNSLKQVLPKLKTKAELEQLVVPDVFAGFGDMPGTDFQSSVPEGEIPEFGDVSSFDWVDDTWEGPENKPNGYH